MQLSRFTDYSVRVLLYSAANPERLVTLSEISQFYNISLEHLRKVVHNLGKLEYLKTHRGKKGGMQLNMAPCDINIGELIGKVEGQSALIDCQAQNCNITAMCGLSSALAKANAAFFNELKQYSLHDIIDSGAMRDLINVDDIIACV
ncbi:MAG: Rrf2 family transcriptional regulator [Pseudomonadales bacterium]|nr:Rrf2 family transcriptional regulator [Pseudomonadales bacterium]